jgi:MFS superfamily sulfate permease-like transporter
VTIVLVAAGFAIAVLEAAPDLSLGPSHVAAPSIDGAALWTALTLLVLPQIPLTFANSCLATADAARSYFGTRAENVRPSRLAGTLGGANVFAGAVGGMPVCHGAGGLTAHRSFGARTAAAPLMMGTAVLLLAFGVGAGLAGFLAAFPLPVLAAMLAAAGILHLGLLGDLEGRAEWAVAGGVGLVGVTMHLGAGLALGLVLWWAPRLLGRARPVHARAS